MKFTTPRSLIFVMLGIGVVIFLADIRNSTPNDDDVLLQRILLGIAAALAFIPFTRKAIAEGFAWLAAPSPSRRRCIALMIALLAGPLLYGLGAARGRLMLPIWHDESMYRMQTTFLAHGRLTMPALPLPDFFDSPYILVHGVYAPVYFPGTALLHCPAVWMHLPYWFTPLVIATASLVLLYLIVTELIDGLAGLLAVLLMISLVTFRWLALVEMSHAAGMMWGLVALWSWLKWRGRPRVGWAFLAGVAGGFYAITRPLDAVCLLMPIMLAWAWDLRKMRRGDAMKAVVAVVLAAMPLIALQLAFNRSVTGSVMESPLDFYNKTYFNAKSLGLQHVDPSFVPPTPVLLIQKLYAELDRPAMEGFTTPASAIRSWLKERLPTTCTMTLPTPFLLILLPVALLGLSDIRRWVFWSMFWGFLIAAGLFYNFLQHYTIAAAPAAIFAVVLAVNVIRQAWPNAGAAAIFVPLAVLFLALQSIMINRQNLFEPIPAPGSPQGSVSRFNYHQIPAGVKKPAVVFFRFGADEDVWEEPVYNWDVLSPDDAAIIRAHDLGEKRDLELLRYYQKARPDLHVYLFDRPHLKLQSLGSLDSAIASGASDDGWKLTPPK